jgi:hypothetical protein
VVWTLLSGGTLEDRPRYTKSHCFDPFPFPLTNDIRKQQIRALAEELDAHRKRVLADHAHLTLTGLYNVLEKLRAGAPPSALTAAERLIFDDGLVLILQELHDKLDVAVAEAYGWPAKIADEEILARLVKLNRERTGEESKGRVHWLRPDYQVPRFGSVKDKAELNLVGGEMRHGIAAMAGPKPLFPTDEVAQTAAVMVALAEVAAAVDAVALAMRFKQGRRAAAKITAVLAALSRMGFVGTSDGGKTFQLRKAA